MPRILTTDQGTQFESKFFAEISRLSGQHRIHTTVYHPQSNGLVERFHRHLKSALRAAGDWSSRLPWILFGIRFAIKEDLGTSSAQLLCWQTLRFPGDFLADEATERPPMTLKFAEDIRASILKVRPLKTRSRIQSEMFIPQRFTD